MLGYGTLDCYSSGLQHSYADDVWTIAAETGDTVAVSVDTTSDQYAFDPAFWIISPSECRDISADENFDCSYPPDDHLCPSAQFTAEESGDYKVVVFSWGNCNGTESRYKIQGNVTPQ